MAQSNKAVYEYLLGRPVGHQFTSRDVHEQSPGVAKNIIAAVLTRMEELKFVEAAARVIDRRVRGSHILWRLLLPASGMPEMFDVSDGDGGGAGRSCPKERRAVKVRRGLERVGPDGLPVETVDEARRRASEERHVRRANQKVSAPLINHSLAAPAKLSDLLLELAVRVSELEAERDELRAEVQKLASIA